MPIMNSDLTIATTARIVGILAEAEALKSFARDLLKDVTTAAAHRNDEAEFRTLAEMLPAGDPARALLTMSADVKAAGLPPYGRRPTINPAEVRVGMKVVYNDAYIHDILEHTTSAAQDVGEVVEVIYYHPTTRQQVPHWMDGGLADVRVRWSWHEAERRPDRTDVRRLAKAEQV